MHDQVTRRPVVNTPSDERNGQLSPDNQWLLYETDVSGSPQIVVASFADPARSWQVSKSGGTQPRWHPDGSGVGALSQAPERWPIRLERPTCSSD